MIGRQPIRKEFNSLQDEALYDKQCPGFVHCNLDIVWLNVIDVFGKKVFFYLISLHI